MLPKHVQRSILQHLTPGNTGSDRGASCKFPFQIDLLLLGLTRSQERLAEVSETSPRLAMGCSRIQ